MKLVWAKDAKSKKFGLFLILGTKGGRYYSLKTSVMPDPEIHIIRNNSQKLSELSLDDKIVWIKRSCPSSYKSGFRTPHTSNITIVKEYPILN